MGKMTIAATASEGAAGDDPILFRGPFSDTIPRMAALGFEGAELHIYDSDQIDRNHLIHLLNSSRLSLTSIGTGSAYERDGINLGSGDPVVRNAAIRRLEGHMKTAAPFLGTVIIGLIAGRVQDCGGNRSLFIENLLHSLKICVSLAEQYDVLLGFEVMNRFESDYINRIEDGMKLLELIGSDRLKLHIDTVHMNIEENDIGAAIRKAKGMIGHVHIAETNRWYPGYGHYDFKETLKALHDIHYKGALALEITNLPDTDTAARKSLAYLDGILQILE